MDAMDKLTARVSQVHALMSVLVVAHSEIQPSNEIMHDALWAVDDLARDAHEALKAYNQD
jgi:hypothetical protein